MDGTTEPILVVIGYPIAGNPAQFAAERALRSLQGDWRVLSFDVKPQDVAAALEGFSVIGIGGVIIDGSLAAEAQQWHAEKTGSPGTVIDCLFRDEADRLVGDFEQRHWIDEQISRHGGQRLLWIGPRDEQSPASGEGFEEYPVTPANIADLVSHADVVVISSAGQESLELDSEIWPANDGSTLVVDLTEGHAEIPQIRKLGYGVIGENERRIGTLQRWLHRWTGQYPSADVIHDAIEEYMSV